MKIKVLRLRKDWFPWHESNNVSPRTHMLGQPPSAVHRTHLGLLSCALTSTRPAVIVPLL